MKQIKRWISILFYFMYVCDQVGIVQRVAFNGGLADQVMIHLCNCSDLLVSIVTESDFLDLY